MKAGGGGKEKEKVEREWEKGSLQLTPCCLFLNGTQGSSEKFTVTKL